MSVMCNSCKKMFATQSTHNRHVREVHNKDPNPFSYIEDPTWSNRCLECDDTAFPSNKRLIEHLEQIHKMEFKIQSFIVQNLNDFEKWKSDIENLNSCSYILKGRNKSTIGEIVYYYCNRSKTSYKLKSFKEESKKGKYRKSLGTSKLTHSCTSHIRLIKENSRMLVEWQKVHYGHSLDVQHCRLPKHEKQMIATKLINGITPRRILQMTRDNVSENIKRIDLLTAKDIRNIRTSYGIEIKDGERHSNDALFIDLWVEECRKTADNPVLFYKPQGEESSVLKESDFCLIIMNTFQKQMLKTFPNIVAIDGTDGTNSNDFEMTIIMVIDDFQQGFPVATMFSNRIDITVLLTFFSSIKNSIGPIDGKFFISDMTDNSFNAWNQVMGTGFRHLYCSWHVDRSWQSNMSEIEDMAQGADAYKLLKTVQQKVSKSEFFVALKNTISQLYSDEQTKKFAEYFKNTYSNNFMKWAHCFRDNCDVTTKMQLEAMHEVLKCFYLERKAIKKLDEGLHFVLQYVKDKSVERLTRVTEKEVSNPSVQNICLDEHIQLISNDLTNLISSNPLLNRGSNVKSKLRSLISKLGSFDYSSLNDAILSEIHHHLAIINQLIQSPESFNNNNESVQLENEVIEPQLRFASTKKKRSLKEKSTGFKKARELENIDLHEQLVRTCETYEPKKSVISTSKSPLSDHTYF